MASPRNIRSLYVVLTSRCNLRCGYCYQNAKQARRMSWDTLRSSLDLALASDSPEVELVFQGGEPLLELPRIRRAVAYVDRHVPAGKVVTFALITNGMLLDPDAIGLLAGRGFEVQLSFDGVEAAQSLRGATTFSVLDRLIDDLRADHPAFFRRKLTLAITFVPETVRHLADSVEYFLAKGVQQIAIAPVFTQSDGWTGDGIHDLDRQFERIYRSSLRHFHRTDEIPVKALRGARNGTLPPPERPPKQPGTQPAKRRAERPVRRSMCGVARGEAPTVDVDGQVHACSVFTESFQAFPSEFLRSRVEALRLGDLRDPAFAERYTELGDAARATGVFDDKQRKHSSYGECADCEFLASCSICPASIGHIPGNTDPHRVPDFLCATNLVSLKYRKRFPHRAQGADLLTEGHAPSQQMEELLAFADAPARRKPA